MRTLAALLIVLFPSLLYADDDHGGFTKHKQGSHFGVTAQKRFSVEMELAGGTLVVGENSGEIVVHDSADGDIKGAEVTVTPWMPSMGHGAPEDPVVREKEELFGSRYLLEKLVITMGGHWEILVEVEKDGLKDGVVFDFPDVGGEGAMEMPQAIKRVDRPADLDLAANRLSEKGLFTVTYRSDPSPPPLNRLHAWSLTVTDAAGSPVEGAKISFEGGMPEHGHGLPTAPEVTEEISPGTYLLEGVKFTMPGWWELRLRIAGAGGEDAVTFNLLLK